MIKKINLLIFFLLFAFNVSALTYDGCDYSEISKLKSLVGNINISYDYHIVDNIAYFDVTISNVTSEMYFIDSSTNKTYYYSDTKNGEITLSGYAGVSGSYKFYSNISGCSDKNLGSKYYKFPTYNMYYNDPLCDGVESYSLCQKWAKINYSYDEFKSLVYDYKARLNLDHYTIEDIKYQKNFLNDILEFYIKYYYYFLLTIILLCLIIILVKRKKEKFKL